MKTPNGIQTELRNLLDLLIQSEVATFVSPVVRQQLPSGICRITWAQGKITTIPSGFQCEFGTIKEYITWVQTEAYSAVLYDGAIIQLSYDFAGNDLVGHRLVYYPCPFAVDYALLREEPMLDVMELYRQQDDSYVRLRSPLRFEFDLQAQAQGHPASHLTIHSDDCRLAVVAALSPGHFVRFIFRHFYPRLWSTLEFVREWPQELGDRTITVDEERLLHIACAR